MDGIGTPPTMCFLYTRIRCRRNNNNIIITTLPRGHNNNNNILLCLVVFPEPSNCTIGPRPLSFCRHHHRVFCSLRRCWLFLMNIREAAIIHNDILLFYMIDWQTVVVFCRHHTTSNIPSRYLAGYIFAGLSAVRETQDDNFYYFIVTNHAVSVKSLVCL